MESKLNICSCCHFETNEPLNEVDVSRFNEGNEQIDKLCNICYSSAAGSRYTYASEYNVILQHISYVGNVILEAIKNKGTI